ncbi:MAG: hypothetical protein NTW25_10040 [Candidatus Kapabacteria bacterium]|nr:hypothetical protein [Candidatus Kapabacteria bacterium]
MDLEFDKFTDDDNPFAFEFNADDVVNREDEITDPFAADFNESKLDKKPNKKAFISESDLEQILNYKDESRKDRLFASKIAPDAESVNIKPDELHKHFSDYLILPKISGLNNKIPSSNRLPSDYVSSRGEKVEIADDPYLDKTKETPASVIVNRDQHGEVESIEVICQCGERTFIKFDFAEENEKFDLTEIYNKEIEEPLEFDMKKLKQRPKIASVNIEDILTAEDRNNLVDDLHEKKQTSSLDDFEKLLDNNFT